MIVDVNEFSPVGDGVKNDANAINLAIEKCAKNGGGKVIVGGKKTYKCGTLFFKSNVTLVVEKDTVIIASDDLNDFYDIGSGNRSTNITRPTWENCEYNGKPSRYFLYAVGESNIGIDGEGIIDGNEEVYYGTVTKWHIEGAFYPRVPLIYFENCKDVTIKNVTLRRSAFWTTHLVGCDGVKIDKLTIRNNLRFANCDGIDPDHCKNIEITNCDIQCADDCIVFKTTEGAQEYGACEHIKVSGCNLMSTSAAIKFGTESVSDFKDITVSDCNIYGTNRGISMMLRDCGNIDDVTFKNIKISTRRFSPIHWWGKAEPIAVTAVRRKPSTKVGNISNVTFSNITCEGENGILIYGEKHNNIKGISLNDISVSIVKKTDWEKGMHDLRPSEEYGIIDGKTNVLYARNASGVTVQNLTYSISEEMKKEVPQPIDGDDCIKFINK
jgi:polygalacturonase